jgi:hypothetical protein
MSASHAMVQQKVIRAERLRVAPRLAEREPVLASRAALARLEPALGERSARSDDAGDEPL